jgi:uncharacterized protein (DUF433 family)
MILEEILSVDPEILGGTPVFSGTRVPVASLFDHLEGGSSLEEFLENFPSVRKDFAIRLLEVSKIAILRMSGNNPIHEDPDRRKSA